MTGLPQRGEIIALVNDAIESGARQDRACAAICLSERTLQRWQYDTQRCDQRPIRVQTPKNSRPAVSNDNPYSESLFKTLKYHHAYPRQPFENLLAARQWVGSFVPWYNHEPRHS